MAGRTLKQMAAQGLEAMKRMDAPDRSAMGRDMDQYKQRIEKAMGGQRIGAPRTMPRAGVNTRTAAPRKNRRSTSRG